MKEFEGKIYFVRKQEDYPDIVMSAEGYFADFRKRIQQMIGLVENICYANEGGRDKELWNNFNTAQFNTFRRRMLDIADEIGELDRNMIVQCADTEATERTGLLGTLLSRKGR